MYKEEKLLTIIIVTYNAAGTFQKCLDSIVNQSAFSIIDIVVIDGQSVDDTINILAKNQEQITYWKSEPDRGIYDAMNKALNHIHTPWVYFMGADDSLLPDFSSYLTVLQDETHIYYANVLYKGKKCSGHITPYRQAKLGLFHQSIIYPSSVFKKYKYNTKYRIAADYALNMQLYKDPEYTFAYKDYVIADYNHTGVSAIKDQAFEADKSKMIFQYFGFKIWSRYIFRLFKAILFSKHTPNEN